MKKREKINKDYLVLGGLVALTLTSGAILSSLRVSADDSVVDDVTITVPVSCSMSGNVDTAHTATLNNGIYSAASGSDYENGIGKTTLTTFCNDYNGFSIYAIGYTNNTEGTNTLIGQSTGQTINTAVYTSGDTTSSWSMKLTKVTDTTSAYLPNNLTITNSFDDYHAVPTEYTQVATYHANTGSSATDTVLGSKLETTYAAYISNTQVADTYEGKVKYVLVHPSTMVAGTYTINYLANGGSGTMTNSTVTGLYNFESQTLAENGYTAPSGYQFAGWCTVQDQTASGVVSGANPQTTCTGNSYAASSILSASPSTSATANGTMNLYAYWSKLPYSSCPTSPMISTVASGITYMQDINSSNSTTVLSALTTNTTYQIKDNRDNETYCVAKLADGKLWMLDNLALDLTDSTILNNLSSDNTNASTGLPYLKGTSTGTTSDKYATSPVSVFDSTNTYSDPRVSLASKNVVPTDATSTAGGYKVGGYYNYCAASAGSYCYGNGTSYGTSSGNATESICPKGWRMPTGNTSGEYSALANAIYGSTSSTSDATAYANYRAALHLPLSGYFYSGSAYDQGSNGRWWSSTRDVNYLMYTLNASTSTINPAYSSNRRNGYSLRCVAGS